MIKDSRDHEANFAAKQDGKATNIKNQWPSSSSSSSWSRLKDPRIVRVSRAFGGKDRHSKVCTVKGLRDRRVRLSVPTAIQLYDLQDRLGFSQPSKVVDWLLNAAKNEIDELPPLQMPPGNFGLINHLVNNSHGVGALESDKEGLKINSGINWDNFWSSDEALRGKSKDVERETTYEKENWTKGDEEEGAYVSSHNISLRPNHNHSSPPGNLLNMAMPYNSFFRLDPSNLSLSQSGSQEVNITPHAEDFHNFNVVQLPSALSIPPGAAQSYFPSHFTSGMEFDPKQINFQMLNPNLQNPLSNSMTPPLFPTGQFVRPFHLSMASKLPHPENSPRKEDDHFGSK